MGCRARVSELPGACHVCALTLVSSPHLARSYHHLFPVPPFAEVTPVEIADLAVVHSPCPSIPSIAPRLAQASWLAVSSHYHGAAQRGWG